MTAEEAGARARHGDTTRYKPMHEGVVHDPGRAVPYGGVTTARQYTFSLRHNGSDPRLSPATRSRHACCV